MSNMCIEAGSQKRRLLATLLLAAAAVKASTFTVTTINDSGAGSLRQAITDANNNAGADTIVFSIPGTAPFSINLTTGLPAITETVSIDGTSQPGFASKPVVVLNGAGLVASVNGLTLNSGGNVIRGLVIKSFTRFGIEALAAAGGTNTIQGCFIGTDANGTVAQTNLFGGIHLGASSDNLIGGTNALEGNLISGNNNDGIWIEGQPGSARNQIVGNWIGTAYGGTGPLGNAQQGVRITAGQFNVVGGTTAAARNVISGNGQSGVTIEGATSTNNVIAGNYIGLNNTGTSGLANGQYGVRLLSGARLNTVGGTNSGAGNVISGNAKTGVDLSAGAQNNAIQGNFIGLSQSGTNAVPNNESGIAMVAATNNLVGGTSPEARNVISGNAQAGIFVSGLSRSNRLEGNYIGLDATGAKAVGNTGSGVLITNALYNVVGSAAGGGNVIAGNADSGVIIRLATTTGNQLLGNFIGTDATGTTAIGNGTNYGILIDHSPANQIGGATAGARNLISGNYDGISIVGNSASNNVIQGNYIGTDASGTTGVSNRFQGITITGTGPEIVYDTLIGGTNSGEGNVISANGSSPMFRPGIYLKYATRTRIQGNLIGVAADGVSPLGNLAHNVEIDFVTNTVIGGSGPFAGNVIANAIDSQRSGVRVRNGTGNAILGNSIYGNGRMGISFNGLSPTANDSSCDSDSGVNGLQNYPVLTNAVSDGIATTIKGYLPSTAGQSYQVQFFASPTVNASGYWEGRKFLGAATVTLGAICTNSFVARLPIAAPAGWSITATATDPANSTSEFTSTAIPLGNAPALSIQSQNDASVSISWLLTNAFGGTWQLTAATNFTPPVVWDNVTDVPVVTSNGTWFTVTVDSTNSTRFFRLLYQ